MPDQIRISAETYKQQQEDGSFEDYLRGSGIDLTQPGKIEQQGDAVVVTHGDASGEPLSDVLSGFTLDESQLNQPQPEPAPAEVAGTFVGTTVRSQPEGDQNPDVTTALPFGEEKTPSGSGEEPAPSAWDGGQTPEQGGPQGPVDEPPVEQSDATQAVPDAMPQFETWTKAELRQYLEENEVFIAENERKQVYVDEAERVYEEKNPD